MMRALPILLGIAAAAAAQTETALPEQLRGVGIDQLLNEAVPLDAGFVDESGGRIALGSLFRGKPVVLAFVYYECPMLCNMQLNGLLRAMRAISLTAGDQFDVLTVSFDPRETPAQAAAKKQQYIRQYGRAGAERGWRFLTGDQPSIERLTRAAGFRYTFDSKSGQWAHASGVMLLTPGGRLARYLYGVEFSARDLRLGLVEASRGRIGSPVDKMLLYCFHYDPLRGRYGVAILNVVRAAGVATLLALCGFWGLMYRRSRRPG